MSMTIRNPFFRRRREMIRVTHLPWDSRPELQPQLHHPPLKEAHSIYHQLMPRLHSYMTRSPKSLVSQPVLAISAENVNSKPKHSALNYAHDGGRSIDTNMFKIPPILRSTRTDIEYMAARYSAKSQTNTMNAESTGLVIPKQSSLLRADSTHNISQYSAKLGPIVRTASGYGVGQFSTTLRSDDMDFQCRGLAVSSDIQPVSRTDTEYSSMYYSAESRISSRSVTVVKRQTRLRAPTDEVSEEPKKVSFNC
jgi:hypothetical protein